MLGRSVADLMDELITGTVGSEAVSSGHVVSHGYYAWSPSTAPGTACVRTTLGHPSPIGCTGCLDCLECLNGKSPLDAQVHEELSVFGCAPNKRRPAHVTRLDARRLVSQAGGSEPVDWPGVLA